MKRHDYVYHPTFGQCVVQDVVGDRAVINTVRSIETVNISELHPEEKNLQRDVAQLCQDYGYKCLHLEKSKSGTSKTQQAGWPDCIIMADGETYYIELKKQDGRLSKSQKNFRDYCKKNSFKYYVCRSISDVKKVLVSEWITDYSYSGKPKGRTKKAVQLDK